MLQTFALVCGYTSDDDIIFAEEAIYLMRLDIPKNVPDADADDYLWDETEKIFSKIASPLGSIKLFDFGGSGMVECELFHREVRQISNTELELTAKVSVGPILMSKSYLEFQCYEDFEDYMRGNEPGNPDRVLDIKMSRLN